MINSTRVVVDPMEVVHEVAERRVALVVETDELSIENGVSGKSSAHL